MIAASTVYAKEGGIECVKSLRLRFCLYGNSGRACYKQTKGWGVIPQRSENVHL